MRSLAIIGLLFAQFSWGMDVFDKDYQSYVVTADQMTCAQAVAHYEKYGRIYVVAHGKDIVPIYGMKPISQSRDLQCRGRSQMKQTYFVKTKDKARCGIAVFCQ